MRSSTSGKDSLALSFKNSDGGVNHVVIKCHPNGYHLENEAHKVFPTLEELLYSIKEVELLGIGPIPGKSIPQKDETHPLSSTYVMASTKQEVRTSSNTNDTEEEEELVDKRQLQKKAKSLLDSINKNSKSSQN